MKVLNLKIVLIFLLIFSHTALKSKDFAIIHGNKFKNLKVKTALDFESKKKGLMNTKTLIDYNGMLFVYEKPRIVNMWMYKTYIPLDIIFIGDNGKIILIKEGIPNTKSLISSEKKVNAVLEIKKGCAEKLNLKKGNFLSWDFKSLSEIKEFRYYDCLD